MAYTDIDDPSAYFQTKLYTGTNNELVLTFDGNSDLQPNMIWTKNRSRASTNHVLSDTVRAIGKGLYPDTTGAEGDTNYISAIGSNGYTIVATDSVEINRDDDTFVSWNWKESATAGMDIVSYTGNATARTISHSLSAVPAWMIIKCRSEDGHSWKVYHKSIGATKTLALQNNSTPDDDANYHGDTEPTSSVFTIGSNGDVNDDGETFIAYLFAEKQAYSKFGSYIANGNSTNFIYTGFKPAWLMVRQIESGGNVNWGIFDNKRLGFNSQNGFLYANTNGAEDTSNATSIDLLSNGFQLRANTVGSNPGKNYIYMAFAEQPFVTSTGVPATAR